MSLKSLVIRCFDGVLLDHLVEISLILNEVFLVKLLLLRIFLLSLVIVVDKLLLLFLVTSIGVIIAVDIIDVAINPLANILVIFFIIYITFLIITFLSYIFKQLLVKIFCLFIKNKSLNTISSATGFFKKIIQHFKRFIEY